MKRMLALALTLTLTATMFYGCGSSESASPSTESSDAQTASADVSIPEGGEHSLTVGIISTNGGFDHVGTHGQSDDLNTDLAWGALFRQDPETGDNVPDMVDTYEWVDETHLKMTLKSGITAADGEEITAEDVIYSLKRYSDENSRLANFVEQYDFDNCTIDENDPLTFTLAYTEVFGPALRYMYLPIVPMDWATTTGEDDAVWWDQPNSTGPYECVENVDGAYVTFSLRDDYWGDTTGMAQTVIIRYYGDESTMYVDYQNNVLDACFGLSSDDAENLADVKDSNVVIQSTNDVYALILPEYVEQFKDENVREAVAHAIDWEQVAAAGFDTLYETATSIIPESVEYYKNTGMPYEYDPELAAELMAKSSYADGFDLDVVITNSSENINMMTVIQAYLQTIGINVSIEQYDIPTAVPMMQEGDTGLSLNHSMGGNPQRDPAISVLNYTSETTNLSVQITDSTWNELLNTGLHTADGTERQACYEDLQDLAVDQYRILPICEAASAYAYHDTLAKAACASVSAPDLTQFILAD